MGPNLRFERSEPCETALFLDVSVPERWPLPHAPAAPGV